MHTSQIDSYQSVIQSSLIPNDGGGGGEEGGGGGLYTWKLWRYYKPLALSIALGDWLPGAATTAEYEIELINGDTRLAYATGIIGETINLDISQLAPAAELGTSQLRIYRRVNAGSGTSVNASPHGTLLAATAVYEGAPATQLISESRNHPEDAELPEDVITSVPFARTATSELQVSQLIISALPADTDRVVLAYRIKNSAAAFQFVPMINVDGINPGLYGGLGRLGFFALPFENTSFANGREYEFQTLALDSAGRLVASNSGSFRQESNGSVTVMPPSGTTPLLSANGGALVVGSSRIAFVDNTPNPTGAVRGAYIRYLRADGSWTDRAPLAAGIPEIGGTLNSGFTWEPPSGLNVCNYVLEITENDGNTVVNRMAGQIDDGVPPAVASHGRLEDRFSIVKIGALPGGTQSVTVRYTLNGQTRQSTAIPSLTEPGVFLWDALGVGDGAVYDYVIEARGSTNQLLGTSTGRIYLDGANPHTSTQVERHGSASASGPANLNHAHWKLSPTAGMLVGQQQGYNAFGELTSQTNARGHVTSFDYDGAGRLLRQIGPAGDYTTAQGQVVHDYRPVTEYQYSLGGRLVRARDANGNETRYTRLNLTDASGQAVVYREEVFNTNGVHLKDELSEYNVFGEIKTAYVGKSSYDARRTDYAYNHAGQITRMTLLSSSGESTLYEELYGYDQAGRRTTVTRRTFDTSPVSNGTTFVEGTDKTAYDAAGRVLRTESAEGAVTTHAYGFSMQVQGIGGQAVGGYVETIQVQGNKWNQAQKNVDYFNHQTYSKDASGHETWSTFNYSGLLSQQTGSTGQNVSYTYYANGLAKSVTDHDNGRRTDYEYDADNNKTAIQISSLPGAIGGAHILDLTTMRYDAQNRITFIGSDEAKVERQYDRAGNIRLSRTTSYSHMGGFPGIPATRELWYTYDALNRVLISQGSKNAGGTIERGNYGIEFGYNELGERSRAHYGASAEGNVSAREQVEYYNYYANGEMSHVDVYRDLGQSSQLYLSSFRHAEIVDGKLVQVQTERRSDQPSVRWKTLRTTYNLDKLVMQESVEDHIDELSSTSKEVTYYYKGDKRTLDSTHEYSYQIQKESTEPGADWIRTEGDLSTTYSEYVWWGDNLQQKKVDVYGTNGVWDKLPDDRLEFRNTSQTSGSTVYEFNSNGHIRSTDGYNSTRVYRAGDTPEYITGSWSKGVFEIDVGGAVHRQNLIQEVKREKDSGIVVEHHFTQNMMADGKTYGTLSNDYQQTIYDVSKTPGPDEKPPAWTPKVVADFDQNYVAVSETTRVGAADRYMVRSGDSLRSIAASFYGNADLWYHLAQANGLSGSETLQSGQILAVPNRATGGYQNTAWTTRGNVIRAENGLLALAAPLNKPKEECSAKPYIAPVLVGIVAVAFAVGTGGGGAPLSAMLVADLLLAGAATGYTTAVIGQVVEMELGLRDDFSGMDLLKGTLLGALGAGASLASVALLGQLPGIANAAARSAVTGALAGAGTEIIDKALDGKPINLKTVLTKAAIGAGIGAAAGAYGEWVRDATKNMSPALANPLRVAGAVGGALGGGVANKGAHKLLLPREKEGPFIGVAIGLLLDAVSAGVQSVQGIIADEKRDEERREQWWALMNDATKGSVAPGPQLAGLDQAFIDQELSAYRLENNPYYGAQDWDGQFVELDREEVDQQLWMEEQIRRIHAQPAIKESVIPRAHLLDPDQAFRDQESSAYRLENNPYYGAQDWDGKFVKLPTAEVNEWLEEARKEAEIKERFRKFLEDEANKPPMSSGVPYWPAYHAPGNEYDLLGDEAARREQTAGRQVKAAASRGMMSWQVTGTFIDYLSAMIQKKFWYGVGSAWVGVPNFGSATLELGEKAGSALVRQFTDSPLERWEGIKAHYVTKIGNTVAEPFQRLYGVGWDLAASAYENTVGQSMGVRYERYQYTPMLDPVDLSDRQIDAIQTAQIYSSTVLGAGKSIFDFVKAPVTNLIDIGQGWLAVQRDALVWAGRSIGLPIPLTAFSNPTYLSDTHHNFVSGSTQAGLIARNVPVLGSAMMLYDTLEGAQGMAGMMGRAMQTGDFSEFAEAAGGQAGGLALQFMLDGAIAKASGRAIPSWRKNIAADMDFVASVGRGMGKWLWNAAAKPIEFLTGVSGLRGQGLALMDKAFAAQHGFESMGQMQKGLKLLQRLERSNQMVAAARNIYPGYYDVDSYASAGPPMLTGSMHPSLDGPAPQLLLPSGPMRPMLPSGPIPSMLPSGPIPSMLPSGLIPRPLLGVGPGSEAIAHRPMNSYVRLGEMVVHAAWGDGPNNTGRLFNPARQLFIDSKHMKPMIAGLAKRSIRVMELEDFEAIHPGKWEQVRKQTLDKNGDGELLGLTYPHNGTEPITIVWNKKVTAYDTMIHEANHAWQNLQLDPNSSRYMVKYYSSIPRGSNVGDLLYLAYGIKNPDLSSVSFLPDKKIPIGPLHTSNWPRSVRPLTERSAYGKGAALDWYYSQVFEGKTPQEVWDSYAPGNVQHTLGMLMNSYSREIDQELHAGNLWEGGKIAALLGYKNPLYRPLGELGLNLGWVPKSEVLKSWLAVPTSDLLRIPARTKQLPPSYYPHFDGYKLIYGPDVRAQSVFEAWQDIPSLYLDSHAGKPIGRGMHKGVYDWTRDPSKVFAVADDGEHGLFLPDQYNPDHIRKMHQEYIENQKLRTMGFNYAEVNGLIKVDNGKGVYKPGLIGEKVHNPVDVRKHIWRPIRSNQRAGNPYWENIPTNLQKAFTDQTVNDLDTNLTAMWRNRVMPDDYQLVLNEKNGRMRGIDASGTLPLKLLWRDFEWQLEFRNEVAKLLGLPVRQIDSFKY